MTSPNGRTDTVQWLRPFDAAQAPSTAMHQALIENGPVVAVPGPGGETAYVVADPALARTMLSDPHFVMNPRFAPLSWQGGRELSLEPPYDEQRSITTADGHQHTLLRRMHVRLFSPSMLQQQRPRIRAIARDMLAELDMRSRASGRPVDLMRDFCYQLPLTVIGGMLGMPERELRELVDTSRASAHASAEDRLAEVTAIAAIIELALRPGEAGSVAAALRDSAEFAELELSEAELSYIVTGLVFAGQETTGAFLGSVLRAYLDRPDRLELDTAARAALVGEVLRRFPAQTFTLWRFAVEDADLGGVRIPAGSPVVADLEACNLHPDTAGPDGERFDPDRGANRHFAFGHGPHTCVGARLAEMEATEVLAALSEHFSQARPERDDESPWMSDPLVRRLATLMVRLS